MTSVRLATVSDIPSMVQLLRFLFAQEAEFEPSTKRQTKGLKTLMASPDRGRVLVYDDERQIVGMVTLLYSVSTALGGVVAVLEDMIVLPDARERGVGRRLIAAAIDQCRSDGCRRITLLTDQDNTTAQAFYERAGFSRSSMVPFRLLLD